MTKEFRVTGLNFDSRIEDPQPASNISWYELLEVKAKCWSWLEECGEYL